MGTGSCFWKEVSKVNGWKVESYSRIKDGNGRLTHEKDYFEDYIVQILKSRLQWCSER